MAETSAAAAAAAAATTQKTAEKERPPKRRRHGGIARWRIVDEDGLRRFSIGDEVFLRPKSAREVGKRGTVVELEEDRVLVRFAQDQNVKSCRRKRLISVLKNLGDSTMVLLTSETTPYRQLAASQVQSTDQVLEIGPSTGLCSIVLQRYAKKWMAFETSQDMIDTCVTQQKLPSDCIHKLDALQDPRRAKQLVESSFGENTHAVFIDIGGNREFDAVLRMTHWVLENFQPRLIVIKSRSVMDKIKQTLPSLKVNDSVPDAWIQKQLLSVRKKLPHHPLQAPLSLSPIDSKTPICRYHNYHEGGCQRRQNCSFDHEHCHLCLKKGHIARKCPEIH